MKIIFIMRVKFILNDIELRMRERFSVEQWK